MNELKARDKRDGVAVTVYNEGTALIRDQRTLSLNEGLNTINFTDVASTIDRTSVTFKSRSNPDGTHVLEQNYIYDLVNSDALLTRYLDETISITTADGTVYVGQLLSGRNREAILRTDSGEVVVVRLADARDVRFPQLPQGLITRPTLQWLLSSSVSGEQQIELNYLAGGMEWSADYNILLATDSNTLDLNGWVTLENRSGRAFHDAQLKLVAGDLNRIDPDYSTSDYREYRMMTSEPNASSRKVAQRELFEYQLYEVERLVTIGNNETKQIEFVAGANVKAQTFFKYDESPDAFYRYPLDSPTHDGTYKKGDVRTYLEFNTGKESGLDADLPAGRIRVYQEDVDGAGLLIGENEIDHTPNGEDVIIYLGDAFDIVGERKQTNFEYINEHTIQETFEIRLRNRKDEQAVMVRIPERLYRWRDWSIVASSHVFKKESSSAIEFRVTVQPKAETVVMYTVRYSFPDR
jgi:hypothetical protein